MSIYNKIKYLGKQFVDKVATPTYLYCVNKLIAIKKIIVMIFTASKKAIILIIRLIKKIVVSFYEVVVILLKNLNGLYFSVLLYSRKGLMGLGIVG